MEIKKAAVLGGGSFGTVVANILADNQIETVQWMRNEESVNSINTRHENPRYLPDIQLNPSLTATTDIVTAVAQADIIFMSIPSKSVRAVAEQIVSVVRPEQAIISTTKGIEPERFLLMSQVLQEIFPQ